MKLSRRVIGQHLSALQAESHLQMSLGIGKENQSSVKMDYICLLRGQLWNCCYALLLSAITCSKQLKCSDPHLKWLNHETDGYSCIIIITSMMWKENSFYLQGLVDNENYMIKSSVYPLSVIVIILSCWVGKEVRVLTFHLVGLFWLVAQVFVFNHIHRFSLYS